MSLKDKVVFSIQVNPFDSRAETSVLTVEQCKEEFLNISFLKEDIHNIRADLYVNGELNDLKTYDINQIKSGDHFLIKVIPTGGGGDGKEIGRTIAMLGVMAASIIIPGSAGLALKGISYFATSMAINFGGTMLVNAIMPYQPNTPKFDAAKLSDIEQSQTYSWSPPRNQINEGGSIPVLYGKHRVTPYLISRYISLENGEQRLNALYAISEGPIDSISDIRINGQDISTFDNVWTDIRLGTNTQDVIPGFQEIISDQSVGQAVEWNDPAEAQTQGSNFDKLGVGINFPQGIYELDDNGNPQDFQINIKIQVKLGSGGYQDFVPNNSPPEYIGGGEFQYTIGSQRTIRLFYYMDLSSGGEQATIKVQYQYEPPNDFKHGTALNFEHIHEVLDRPFRYPNTALLAVKAMATNELNGSLPVVDCIAEKKWVDVHTGSGWEVRPADNPAFASYDILRHPRYGANVPEVDFIFDDFRNWSDWCNIKSIRGNFHFDSTIDVAKALNHTGTLGRAIVVQRGTKFGVIVDKPEVPTQLFTESNIKKDSLQVDYLPLHDRANVIEVTYFPDHDDNNRQIVEIKSDNFDLSNIDKNKISVTLIGCTDQNTAIAHGKHLLNSNELLTKAVKFEASVDAIACQPGDVFELQSKVTGYGLESGRIVAISGNDVTLNKELTLESGETYQFTFRRGGTDFLYRETVTGDLTTDTFTLADVTDLMIDDVWAFGLEGLQTNKFRVQEINRTHDMEVSVTATEYDERVYQDYYDYPEPESDTSLKTVDDLQLEEIWRLDEAGVGRPIVAARWRGNAIAWRLDFLGTSPDGQGLAVATVYEPYAEALPEAHALRSGKTYYFRVQSVSNPGVVSIESITIKGKPNPPSDVTNLQSHIGPLDVSLSWDSVIDPDLGGYIVRLDGAIVGDNVSFNTFSLGEILAGTYTASISARDIFNQESENPTTIQLNILPPDTPNISARVDKANVIFSWPDTETSLAISHYEIEHPGGTINIKSNSYSYKVESGLAQQLRVRAVDIAGNKSDWALGEYQVTVPGASSIEWTIDGSGLLGMIWETTPGDLAIAYWIVNGEQVSSPQITKSIHWQTKEFCIAAYDIAGNAGVTTKITVSIDVPSAPHATYSFVGSDILIEIDKSSIQADLPIRSFKIDDSLKTDNIFKERVNYKTHTYSISAIDTAGNEGNTTSLVIDIEPPLKADTFTADVIDNFVTFKWSDTNSKGSLPIDRWEVLRGNSFDTATSIHFILANFAHTSELSAGTHRFWLVGYDTAGNKGTESSLVAEINEPRGFVLKGTNYAAGFKPATQTFFHNYHYGSKLYLRDEIENEIWWMDDVEAVGGTSLVSNEKKYGFNSFYFDGVDGKIRTTNGTSFTLDSVFMASCWIKFDLSGTPNNSQYIFANLGGGDSRKWRLRYDRTANELQFRILAGPSVDAIASHSTLDDGNWHFVMVGKDNLDNIHIWVDLVDLTLTTDQISGNSYNVGTPGQPHYLGSWHNSSNDFFKGWMDDVRIVADYIAPSTITLPDQILLPQDVRLQNAEKEFFLEEGDETEDVWVSVDSEISWDTFWGSDTWDDKYSSGALFFEPFAKTDAIDSPVKTWNIGTEVTNTVIDISLDRELYVGLDSDYQIEADVLDSNDTVLQTLVGNPTIKEYVESVHKVNARVVDTASGNPVLMQLKGLSMRVKVREIEEFGKDSITTNPSAGKTITFTKAFKDVEAIIPSVKAGGAAVTILYDFNDVPNPTEATFFLKDENGNYVTGDFGYLIKGVQ